MNKNLRILIVDDDPGIRDTFPDVLEELGYEVGVADSGSAAVDMVQMNQYDVAFIDIKMPGMNGVETFQAIRSISPWIRVFMMTGFSVESQVKQALDEGALDITYKPLDIDHVLDLIERE